MAHVLVYKEWQGGSGNWYCNDVSDLAGISGKWWVPARMLEMAPAAYVQWLIDNYHPTTLIWNGEILIYSWDKNHYADMHKFVLYINRIARQKNFLV